MFVTVGAALTTWLTDDEVLPLKLALPTYVAVMVLVPTVVNVRSQDVAGKVIVQETTVSETVIVPPGVVGEFPYAPVTLTLTVTDSPTIEGVLESAAALVIAAVVFALLMVKLKILEPTGEVLSLLTRA